MPISRREAALAAGVGALVFLVCCALVGGGLFDRAPYGDVHLYRDYGELMRQGKLPYRDFYDEYPPLAQPVFLFATLAAGYATFFKWTMAVCGAVAVALVAVTLARRPAGRRLLWVAVGAAAVAPLVTGPIFLNAYDLWPALLVAAGIAALVHGRPTAAFVLLGLATAAKVYPLAPALVAAAWVYRREGRPALVRAAVAFVVAVAAASVFFAVTGPGGLRYSTEVQLRRGLEVHSLGGAVLLAGDRLGLHRVATAVQPPGSENVVGAAARAVGVLTSLLEIAAVLLVVYLVSRGPPTTERLLLGVAAAVVAVVAFQKVFSAQYVDWLVPAVPPAGVVAAALMLVVLGLTRLVFSENTPVWSQLARDLVVVALFAWLALRLRGPAAQRDE